LVKGKKWCSQNIQCSKTFLQTDRSHTGQRIDQSQLSTDFAITDFVIKIVFWAIYKSTRTLQESMANDIRLSGTMSV
jgi:hypothetical protein